MSLENVDYMEAHYGGDRLVGAAAGVYHIAAVRGYGMLVGFWRTRGVPLLLVAVLLLLYAQIRAVEAQTVTYLYPTSVFRSPIPANATYVRETRFGSFRQGQEVWGAPVYRVAAGSTVPLVTITNTYSGRVETWPIPTSALPAAEEDGHMAVVHYGNGLVYEFYAAVWTSPTTISAGGMASFPISGSGVSNPPFRRVTAAGLANTFGMVMREDFINPSTGQLDSTRTINHALAVLLPFSILGTNTYVAPAVGGEEGGTAGVNGIPMGAWFALPRSLNVDALSGIHPFTRQLLRAARDYGMYVSDAANPPQYNGNNVGTIEVEPGLIQALYGVSGDSLISRIQQEVYNVVVTAGIYRVNGGGVTQLPSETPTFTRTPTSAATATRTPSPTMTRTPSVTPTATRTPTSAATATRTPSPTMTRTPSVTPTATRTPSTPLPPAATATRTPSPTMTHTPSVTPTFTRTPTSAATATRTPSPTMTRTPSVTPTATRTPSPTMTRTP
ncbi:MAG: hypothetical protein HXY40_17580, partial [Chloroflexi bacterium]|nr:hypothetical protein [Chloroflexota bacterium]